MRKSIIYTLSSILLITSTLASCSNNNQNSSENTSIPNDNIVVDEVELNSKKPSYQEEDHTDNYIDDIYRNYYQILVYSYFDSNNDGIGDLNGLISKLDYINDGNPNSKTSLGYDGIYLLPIFPSPTYHKYDATNYYSIDPSYGTLDDFDRLISEANKRGIDVILDLAVNHTSNQHPWFKETKALLQTISEFDSETGEPTLEAKENNPVLHYYHIINKDYVDNYRGAKWHAISGTNWLYEGSFYDGMPDLNLDDPYVLNEIKNIMKFWLDRGVSGFRLDAVEHYFDWNKQKNYEVLNMISSWGKELTVGRKKSCYLVAEGPWSTSVTSYYENTNDISYMNFNFGSGGQAKLATLINNSSLYNKKYEKLTNEGVEIKYSDPSSGKSFDIVNDGTAFAVRCASDYFRAIVSNWDNALYKADSNAIDANFGVNHDTMRAINQLAGNFKDDALANACKMFWGINNTLSGVSFNYYGEEIGMKAGSSADPDKRHPMYWSETNTKGMTKYAEGANKTNQYLAPADEQINDENSLWNFMRELNRAKRFFPEIARGKQNFIKVGQFYSLMEKSYNGNKIYLLYNFSSKALSIPLNELGLEEEPTEIKYSLSSSSSYYAKLSAGSINVPAYSITII